MLNDVDWQLAMLDVDPEAEFRTLLSELNVSPFAAWQVESHRLASDSRFHSMCYTDFSLTKVG